MEDKSSFIIAVFLGLMLAGIFLPFINYALLYENDNQTIETLMTVLFPIVGLLGGIMTVYHLKKD